MLYMIVVILQNRTWMPYNSGSILYYLMKLSFSSFFLFNFMDSVYVYLERWDGSYIYRVIAVYSSDFFQYSFYLMDFLKDGIICELCHDWCIKVLGFSSYSLNVKDSLPFAMVPQDLCTMIYIENLKKGPVFSPKEIIE